MAAICDTVRRPRTIIAVPSGKGKSRIMAAIIVLKFDYSKEKHYTILYSSDLLKSVD